MEVIFFIIFLGFVLIGPILKAGRENEKKDDDIKRSLNSPRPVSGDISDMERARKRLQDIIVKERRGDTFHQKEREKDLSQNKREVFVSPVPVEEKPDFDYNVALAKAEELLSQSNIKLSAQTNSIAMGDITKTRSISLSENISDLVHDEIFLKKSIVISEILDKPLSLRG